MDRDLAIMRQLPANLHEPARRAYATVSRCLPTGQWHLEMFYAMWRECYAVATATPESDWEDTG